MLVLCRLGGAIPAICAPGFTRSCILTIDNSIDHDRALSMWMMDIEEIESPILKSKMVELIVEIMRTLVMIMKLGTKKNHSWSVQQQLL